MNKKLTEYKLKNGTVIPEIVAVKLAEMSNRLDTHIAKLKADIINAKNNL